MPIFSTLLTIRVDKRHQYYMMEWACCRCSLVIKRCMSLHVILIIDAVNIIGILSDPFPIYSVSQHWLLATDSDRVVGLLLSLHPCSNIDYQYFMETCASLDYLTSVATPHSIIQYW